MSRGIKAITVEIGNPQLFQNQYVQWSYMGVMRILAYLSMFPPIEVDIPLSNEDDTWMDPENLATRMGSGIRDGEKMVGSPNALQGQGSKTETAIHHKPPNTITCSRGFWIYTKTGGVLEVYPPVNTVVRKGDLIARIKNIFGNIVDEIFCPSHGVVLMLLIK
jgi:predicted deacylase